MRRTDIYIHETLTYHWEWSRI